MSVKALPRLEPSVDEGYEGSNMYDVMSLPVVQTDSIVSHQVASVVEGGEEEEVLDEQEQEEVGCFNLYLA